jgi:hypothetical protein
MIGVCMKLIKLDRRHHGFRTWTHALEFTKYECHARRRVFAPYVQAFKEIYGDENWYDHAANWRESLKWNENWRYDRQRRRIYFKDPGVLTFVELKIA